MKKGIIFTVIILIVAAILTVVFVTLFKERDTDAVADKVISVVDEGYLAEDEDKLTILDYLDNIESNSGVASEEVSISKLFYDTYDKLGDFYRQHIIFTSYTNVYKENRDDVINGFNDATNKANEMVEYINETNPGNNQSWEARTWDDVRLIMADFIAANNRAFIALGNIFPSCEDSLIVNTDFVAAVLDGVNTHLEAYNSTLSADETAVIQEDCVETISNVNEMISNYLTDSLVYGYLYDGTWQSYIADINLNGEKSAYYASFMAGTLL